MAVILQTLRDELMDINAALNAAEAQWTRPGRASCSKGRLTHRRALYKSSLITTASQLGTVILYTSYEAAPLSGLLPTVAS
jgi:hypothetical protein